MTGAWIMRRRMIAPFVAFSLPFAACAGDAEDAGPADTRATVDTTAVPIDIAPVSFDTATATLQAQTHSVTMRVEIADRPDQRAYGLMDRDELAADAGMVFIYDRMQSADSGFWMYRTRIPLDIAYFDGAGRILAIRQMMPCTSFDAAQCPGYAAGVEYIGALEANRGYFARNNIGVGDRITIPGRVGGP